MNPQLVKLDTWLRTYALNPKGFSHWFEIANGLTKLGKVTFTLQADENTTGIDQKITLEAQNG